MANETSSLVAKSLSMHSIITFVQEFGYRKSGNFCYIKFLLENFSCWKIFVGLTSYENILTRKFPDLRYIATMMLSSCLHSMQDNYLKGSVKHHCSYNVASFPNSGVLTYFDWWHTSVWRCGAFTTRERYSIIRSFKTRFVGGCSTDNWKVKYWYGYQTVRIYSNSNYCQTEFCGRLTSHLAGAMYIRTIAWMPLLWHFCTVENL